MAKGNMSGMKYKPKKKDNKLLTPRQRAAQAGRIKRKSYTKKK